MDIATVVYTQAPKNISFRIAINIFKIHGK